MPRYREEVEGVREAGVVWIGGPAARPRYRGCTSEPLITEEMEYNMVEWLADQKMDMVKTTVNFCFNIVCQNQNAQ